jgi:two-component system, cell cycle sensor histidine kinase and response regulator CckA
VNQAGRTVLDSAGGILSELDRGRAILLVEDEQSLRTLMTRILRQHGYTVTAASHPSKARDVVEDHTTTIDLLVTDVVMPEATGTELAAQLQAICPDLRVLYTSGYVPNASELPPGAAFLAKPFSRAQPGSRRDHPPGSASRQPASDAV